MLASSLISAILAGVAWDAGFSGPLFLGPRAAIPALSWAQFRVECEVPVRMRAGISGELFVRVVDVHAGRTYRTDYALAAEFPPGSHKLASLPFFLPSGAKASATLHSSSILAATFPRGLDVRPLMEDSVVYGFLGRPREQTILKKHIYDAGLSLGSDVRLARLRRDRLPTRWEFLSAEGVIAETEMLAGLGGEDLSVLLDYALSGGALVILGQKTGLPRSVARFIPNDGTAQFGAGRLALVERKEGWQKKALACAAPHATRLSRAVPNERGVVATLDRVAVRSASARQLAFILAAYVVLAVPVSAFVFWRLGRKELTWLGSLLVAGAFSLFTVLRGGVLFGEGSELKEVGVLRAASGYRRAVYAGVSAVYSTGSQRLSLLFRRDALVRQASVPSAAKGMASTRRARVEGRTVRDIFVPAQSVRQFVSTGSFDLKGELGAEKVGEGEWRFTNGTCLDLTGCVVRSGAEFLRVGDIPAGCNGRTRGQGGRLGPPKRADVRDLASAFSGEGGTGGSCLLGWAKAPGPPHVENESAGTEAWWLCVFALGGRRGKVEARKTGAGSFLLFLDQLPEGTFTIKASVRTNAQWLQVRCSPGSPDPETVSGESILRIRVNRGDVDPDLPLVRLSLDPLWGLGAEEDLRVELTELEVEM